MQNSVQVKQHTIDDWLALHKLNETIVRQYCALTLPRPPSTQKSTDDDRLPHKFIRNPGAIWQQSKDAMCQLLPIHNQFLQHVANNTTVRFCTKTGSRQKTYTQLDPDTGRISVTCFQSSSPKMVLDLAHEFGHAIQFSVMQRRFSPPIHREVCAFISELAMIDYLRDNNAALHRQTCSIWWRMNRKYLGTHCHALLNAFGSTAPYRYTWNYPIARVCAQQLYSFAPKTALWSLYEGHNPISLLANSLQAAL